MQAGAGSVSPQLLCAWGMLSCRTANMLVNWSPLGAAYLGSSITLVPTVSTITVACGCQPLLEGPVLAMLLFG